MSAPDETPVGVGDVRLAYRVKGITEDVAVFQVN
jgi:hypothetical protein